MAIYKIGLDAGHGLKTAGKQTPDGIKEWTLNDSVADMVEEMLKEYNVEIIRLDNNEGNTDESLSKRYQSYIKAGVNLMVSIHHNALKSTWSSATGVEVFTDKNPTKEDSRLAELIYKKLVSYTGLKGRGVKKENWYVINQNKIPAVLCEGAVAQVQREHTGTQLFSEIRLCGTGKLCHAAIHGVNTGHQLRGAEGLGHIVIRAHHQAGHLVHFLCLGGQHNDADAAAALAQLFAYGQTVHRTGHHNIEDRHIEVAALLLVQTQGFLAVYSLYGIVTGSSQVDHHNLADILFVFRYQYLSHIVNFLSLTHSIF